MKYGPVSVAVACLSRMLLAMFTMLALGDAHAQATALKYESALKNYQPYAEEKVKPWRETNDKVNALGGWRSYAKEAAAQMDKPATPMPTSAPKASSSAPAMPAVSPHSGHGVKP